MRIIYEIYPPGTSTHYAYLPDHYYDLVDLPPPHSYHGINSVEEFEAWVGEPGGVLREYEERPTVSDVPSIEAKVVEVLERPGYTLTKLSMQSFFDPEMSIFYELLPSPTREEAAGYDAVLVIPGSGHQGALDVIGEIGPYAGHYYHDEIGRTLVQEGYAVYVVELRGYGERAMDVGDSCLGRPLSCSSIVLEKKLGALGISMHDLRTDEITQILAWAESRTYTDDIAVAGLSLGGALAVTQAIINYDVIDAVVIASGIGSTLHSPLVLDAGGYDITDCCDSVDPVITIAPMPAYVSFGLQEETFFRWEAETGHSAKLLSDAYELHEKPDNFWYVVHDGGHVYEQESVLDFLKTHL